MLQKPDCMSDVEQQNQNRGDAIKQRCFQAHLAKYLNDGERVIPSIERRNNTWTDRVVAAMASGMRKNSPPGAK
jgi:hypothetical protein